MVRVTTPAVGRIQSDDGNKSARICWCQLGSMHVLSYISFEEAFRNVWRCEYYFDALNIFILDLLLFKIRSGVRVEWPSGLRIS